jgi:hypothetical protein
MLAATEVTGRVFYGPEIDPKHVDVVVERGQALSGKKAKLEGDGRTSNAIQKVRVSDWPSRRRKLRIAGPVRGIVELPKHEPLLVPIDAAGNRPQVSFVEVTDQWEKRICF